jgi:hypothetical protein
MKALLGLVAMLAVAATHAKSLIVATCVLPLIAALIAAHIERDGGQIAEMLVSAAASILPAREQKDWRDEWLDHVQSAGEHGVLPLSRAVSILLLAAPLLAIGLRLGRVKSKAA